MSEACKFFIIAVLFVASLFVCYRVFRSSNNEIRAAQTKIIASQRDNEQIASAARAVADRINTAQKRVDIIATVVNSIAKRVDISIARVESIERVVSSSTSFIDQAESTIDDCLSILEEIKTEAKVK